MKKVLTWIAAAIVGTILGFIILWITSTPVEAAEWEIVLFESPEHLAALQDSVVACRPDSEEVGIVTNGYTGEIIEHTYEYFETCRRLVGVTVVSHPVWDYPHYFNDDLPIEKKMKPEVTPGRAIIFYEEVK